MKYPEQANLDSRLVVVLSFIIAFVLESVLSHLSIATPTFGEGNGTPLQYSCLENPMDGGAW